MVSFLRETSRYKRTGKKEQREDGGNVEPKVRCPNKPIRAYISVFEQGAYFVLESN
jgi:hypothetical protein